MSLCIGFEVSMSKPSLVTLSLLLLPTARDVLTAATSPVPYKPTCHHVPHPDDKELNLRNYKLQLNVSFYKR